MQLVRPRLIAALDVEGALDAALDRLRETPDLPPLGERVVVHRPDRLQAGYLVDQVFPKTGDVVCTCTPSGALASEPGDGIHWTVGDGPRLDLAPPHVPTLKTDRLTLEPGSLDHAPRLQARFADYEVIKHLTQGVPWPYPEDGMVSFLRSFLFPRVADGRAMAWALVHPDHGPIGLLEWRPDPSAIDDRGFWLGRAHWGQGYMTEAVTAFQDWLFFERGHDQLTVRNAVENVGSHRIKEKTGGVFKGLSHCAHHEGDVAELWQVTRASWAAARGVG